MGQDKQRGDRAAEAKPRGADTPARRTADADDPVMKELDEFVRGARIDADMTADRRSLDAKRHTQPKPPAPKPDAGH